MEPQAASPGEPLLGRESGSNEASVLPARRRGAYGECHYTLLALNDSGRYLSCCSPMLRLHDRCCDCAQAGGINSQGLLTRRYGRSLTGQTGDRLHGWNACCSWSWCCLTSSKFQRCSASLPSSGERRRAERERQKPQQSKRDFFQAEYLFVKEFSSESERLQEALYRHSCDILSAEEVHVLRHVLCAERFGPLTADEVNLLHKLLSYTGGDALSSGERQLFIRLLRKRANGDVIDSEEAVTLRTLLLRALANSLSQEQHLNAFAALQSKSVIPMSPHILDYLHRILTGPNNHQGRNAVQAVLEEQLAPYCGWSQQVAIHRLLFLEPPWSLSPEQRHFLETLYVKPAVWWSPAQESRFFTSLAETRAEGALASAKEAVNLLLQLMAASLTTSQRRHLAALLGMPHVQLTCQHPPTILSREQEVALTPAQVRTMAFLQRVFEGEALTPVENGFLQDGILRELLQLLPPDDVRVLYSLALSNDPSPVPRSSMSVLKQLQRARELWESGSDLTGCMKQIGGSEFRHKFICCFAFSLTSQQLKLLTQLLLQNREERRPDEGQHGSQGAYASIHSAVCRSNCPVHGDAVGCTLPEDPTARCRGEKESCNAMQEAVGDPAELKAGSMTALTREQADILERLLELYHAGCQATQQNDLLAEMLSRFKFSGPAFDQPLPFVQELLLLQFSISLSEAQAGFIKCITSERQPPLHQKNAHKNVQTGCAAALPTGDEIVREACHFCSDLITPSHRQLLRWLISQNARQAGACAKRPLSGQLLPPLVNADLPAELLVMVPYQPLLQLARSLSDTQVEMLLALLDGASEEPINQGSERTGENMSMTEADVGGAKEKLPGSQHTGTSISPQRRDQHLTSACSSILAGGLSSTKKADGSMPLRTRGRDSAEALPTLNKCFRYEDFAELARSHSVDIKKHPEEYQDSGSAPLHALSPICVSVAGQFNDVEDGHASLRGHFDGAPDCSLSSLSGNVRSKERSDGELQKNGKSVANLPSPQLNREQPPSPPTCSPEDLVRKRRMVQQLILEAADQRIFLEDLKMWRRQYNQRAKLREVLNPYILKIQTLQQGYLKRCPCLYHQQQDQREEEERQANLKLLDSLGSSIWGTGDQTPSQLGSFSFQGPAFSSEEFQGRGSEEFGTYSHGDSASSGGLSLAAAFRQSSNTPVGRSFSKDRYSSIRQQSLATSREYCTLEQEVLRPSAGSRDRYSSSSPVGKAPSHSSSLSSAPVLASSEGQTPLSSPTRLRSPTGWRAERHQRGNSRDESVTRGDLDVSPEERKRRMQRQALEKAERVKEDARVAFLVAFMKQLQPGTPAVGIELADRVNLCHLNCKTLPRGKGWKTQGLLRMIEGIVMLVCKLPREAEVASLLQPLLALSNQTRAEDIDLAIHAELENIRRVVLRLPVSCSTGAEKGQVGDGSSAGLQKEGKRKTKDGHGGSAVAGPEEDGATITSTELAAAVGKVTRDACRQEFKKNRLKA